MGPRLRLKHLKVPQPVPAREDYLAADWDGWLASGFKPSAAKTLPRRDRDVSCGQPA